MNGWWRLGIVAAALVAIPAGMVGYADAQRSHLWNIRPSSATQAIKVDQSKIDAIWAEFRNRPELRNCVQSKTKITDGYPYNDGLFDIDCDNNSDIVLWGAVKYAAVPFIILWILGMVVTWVYRGFRPPQK